MNEKPENLQITARGNTYVVERNFDLPEGGSISYTVNVPKNEESPRIIDLHRASADRVVRYLLQFLPENFGQYTAGAKESPPAKKA